ncbi:MAG: NnrS family protein [Pseudomonadota bacterium]
MKRLAIAPHRLYFFLGAVAVLSLFFWWWLSLNTPYAAHQSITAIPLHGILMPLGIFPLFILGFTFTAGPRWLAVNASDKYFLPTGIAYFSGIVLIIFGSNGETNLVTAGFGLMLLAWLGATWRWASLVRQSSIADKNHPGVLLAAMCGGVLALLAALVWSAGYSPAWFLARQLAFFCFLLPVFLTVCHRMLPFFSSTVLKPYMAWKPYGLLWFWLAGCAVLALAGVLNWRMVEAVVASSMAVSFAYTSWRWGLRASFVNRLLAMLHLSFAWLSIVFALQAASAFGVVIGSASLHALGLGFMATMLVAFVSRVSFGHSGRPLVVSNVLWVLYLALHLAAAMRVLASVLFMQALISYSATAWLLLLGTWVIMMLPIYLKARADGQAG